jgi:beta-lactamase class A
MDFPPAVDSLLSRLTCQFAFYLREPGTDPIFVCNGERFLSASLLKVPILLAWAILEREGVVSRRALCRVDDEPQVQGAGFAWQLAQRELPYHDVLLMMIATSDNLCTNLVIRHIGIERLDRVFHQQLGLSAHTRLERKFMDYAARAQGLDNWIGARDCVRLFNHIHTLEAHERAWIEPMLLANQDATLLLRDVPRDSLEFYHKTGSIQGVLHDWGYTRRQEIFLLTNAVADEAEANAVFGGFGRLWLREPSI